MRYIAALALALLAVGCSQQCAPKSEQRKVAQQAMISPGHVQGTCSRTRDCCDHYHVIVFAYQNKGRVVRPAQTHTFATWVHTREKEVVEQVDISWGPATGSRLELISDMVQGRNKDLACTCKDMQGRTYKYWVLRTDRSFFEEAAKHRDNLTYYKALDHNTRPKAVNCIHACSDVAGYLDTGTASGIKAGEEVVQFFIRTGKAWRCSEGWPLQVVCQASNCKLP